MLLGPVFSFELLTAGILFTSACYNFEQLVGRTSAAFSNSYQYGSAGPFKIDKDDSPAALIAARRRLEQDAVVAEVLDE